MSLLDGVIIYLSLSIGFSVDWSISPPDSQDLGPINPLLIGCSLDLFLDRFSL